MKAAHRACVLALVSVLVVAGWARADQQIYGDGLANGWQNTRPSLAALARGLPSGQAESIIMTVMKARRPPPGMR